MKLYELLNDVGDFDITSLPQEEITFVTDDSRKVSEGTLFICIKGQNFDGHTVAEEMLDKGAVAVVTEKDLGLKNQIIVENSREAYGIISANFFNRPDKRMKIIGVTGTNGKTTITTGIKNIISEFGIKAGLIGTSQNEIGEEVLHADKTTPEAFELFKLLNNMAESGCEYVIMEVSSQALEQRRVGNMQFEVGIFTNLTQDHLDVHGDMETYYLAKKRMFSLCKTSLINEDDEYGIRYFNEVDCDKKKFSTQKESDFFADCIKMYDQKSSFLYSNGKETYMSEFFMPGEYNVSNGVAILACLETLGFDMGKVTEFLSQFKGVKGRSEVIPTLRDFTVICDYAHTPDAIENVLSNMKKFTRGRLICLFGCGGNRDKRKRPLMCVAAAKHSDFLVITSDNPRDEDPDAIIDDIVVGLKGFHTPYIRITDRREAIFYSIKNAKPGDVIVLAGKGHEDYQVLPNNEKIHFDEREVVAEGLKLL